MNKKTRMLAEAGITIALAVALSFLKIKPVANGGSIDLVMIPLCVFALKWGAGWGCRATAPEKDYVHQTVAAKGYSSYDYMSLRSWEFSNTRNYELDDLDKYISKYQYGTIVIELGENVKGHENHFKEDLTDMIKYIRGYNPNARIVMLDNFWKYDSIIKTKKAVASEMGCTYVSLADIQGVSEYQLHAGDQYTAADGTVYTIGSFLAGHPNDAGFAAIAQRLIAAL